MKIFSKILLLATGLMLASTSFAGYHQKKPTITQIAAGNKNFSTLVTALKTAGLAKVLNKPGNYTVFAPTNSAFNKLPKGTLKSLLLRKNRGKLKSILLYHVINKRIPSSHIRSGYVKTLQGSKLKISVHGHTVRVNNAKVIQADILASNGVIHVINRVLLPGKSRH